MRAECLKEEREKSVRHGRWTPRFATINPEKSGWCGENHWNLLVHCCDISTEHFRGGSHRSPIYDGIMANTAALCPRLRGQAKISFIGGVGDNVRDTAQLLGFQIS